MDREQHNNMVREREAMRAASKDTGTEMVKREQSRFAGKLIAFAAVTSVREGAENPFAVGISVLGEPGYYFPIYADIHKTYDAASERAERLNALLPYDADACTVIIADAMARSQSKREDGDGFTRFTIMVEIGQPADEDALGDMADSIHQIIEAEKEYYDPLAAWGHCSVDPA